MMAISGPVLPSRSSVTVAEGTLRFASAGALASGSNLTTYYTGTAELGGINRSVSHLYQYSGGVVDLGGANLTVNSGDLYQGQITGAGSLIKTSSGSLYIDQANTHTGGTVLQQGNTLVRNTAALGAGTLTLSNGGMVSPGNSPGTLRVGQVEFGVSGIYDWEISSTSNYDRIVSTGTIDVTTTTLNPFVIRLQTLDASNNDGILAGFDMASSYTWLLASGSSITGFNAAKFDLDLDSFYNPADPALFSVAQQGNSIVIQYNASLIPEPSSVMFILSAMGACLIRRKREC
jgi:autotransporter-associated beta strand protein